MSHHWSTHNRKPLRQMYVRSRAATDRNRINRPASCSLIPHAREAIAHGGGGGVSMPALCCELQGRRGLRGYEDGL